jgi:hypothetical protein
MAAATLSPSPKEYFWNSVTGAPLAGGFVYTVTAGGSFPGSAVATYQDSNALIPNANPIPLNAAGYATIYLQPGKTYKYIVTDANGVTQWTQDGIEAVPTTNLALDVTGTAGAAFAAGQVGYLAQDTSGGATPGLFYLGDSANAYSSTLPAVIAVATTAIPLGATGTFRQGGIVAGLSGLIAGSKYFVGTAGSLVSTSPTNSRLVGVADNTTTQLDVSPSPSLYNLVLVSPTITTSVTTPASAGLFYGCCGGRLTLTSGQAVTTGDVTGATSVFFTPYSGSPFAGNIGLYDGSTNWTILPFTEISVALGTLTSGLPYDVFAFNNSGVVALRAPVAWTSTSARATALVLQNGVYVKTGATTDRYLGTFFTDSTTTTSDSSVGSASSGRHLSNYYNRVERPMVRIEPANSWSYGTNTVRQANANTANTLQFVIGVSEDPVYFETTAILQNAVAFQTGIGIDTTTIIDTSCVGITVNGVASPNYVQAGARLRKTVSAGHHAANWLENGLGGSAVVTLSGSTPQSGMQGYVTG